MPSDEHSDLHTDLQRLRFDPTPLPEVTFTLLVVAGPDRGRSFTLDGSQASRALLGQSLACEFQLSDRTVSRRHLSLDVRADRVRVCDLGSSNGTRVNGVRIFEAELAGGELLQLGASSLRLELGEAEPQTVLSEGSQFGTTIGASTEMRRLYPLCERLAASNVPVVIEGETGTGKEVLAESLHRQSARADQPFVVFDCTTVPAQLVEAELFGHDRGAYTGAVNARAGVFQEADGGTLFIDEIGDLELSLQPKLLRAIERNEVRPLGSRGAVRVDVRIIAATRRDLDREVQAGRFRDDLFHRLAVTRIELPPLRARKGDIALLATHLCRQLGHDPSELPNALLLNWEQAPWPGNVRELRNAVARYFALGELAESGLARGERAATDSPLGHDDLVGSLLELPLAEARQRVVEEFERRYIRRQLERCAGNVTHAAAAAGVVRRHFQTLKARSLK